MCHLVFPELVAKMAQIGRSFTEYVRIRSGGVGERLKPAVLKTVRLERASGVRIPPPPPLPVNLFFRKWSSFWRALRRRSRRIGFRRSGFHGEIRGADHRFVGNLIDARDLDRVAARRQGTYGNEPLDGELFSALVKMIWRLHRMPNFLPILGDAVSHGHFGFVGGFVELQIVKLKIDAEFIGA